MKISQLGGMMAGLRFFFAAGAVAAARRNGAL